MKTKQYIFLKFTLLTSLVIGLISCERPYSEDVALATFSTTGEIFTDAPIEMGTDFYFPYGGSKPTAWTVEVGTFYDGLASMRFDVPDADDAEGNYAGAIFRIDGEGSGRDLSGFDALTFWAKASQSVTISEIGFGEDFEENKYVTTLNNVKLTRSWVKHIIPIPDPSKLIQERGMLRYAAAGIGEPGFELGYTFWIDELKFEKLGTVAQPKPAILNGEDVTETVSNGSTVDLAERGLTQTFNLASGKNQTVNAAPSYFTFTSSDIEVARVNELGLVSIHGEGTATITASIAGVRAQGSLIIVTGGDYLHAPIPTLDPSRVISIYSDAYTNVNVDFMNGYWEPWQTTLSEEKVINGDNIIEYSEFNFVGNQFGSPTVDATNFSNLHVNMIINDDNIPANLDFLISIVDFGADGVDGGGDDTRQQVFFKNADFTEGAWSSLEIPITLANKNNIGQIIYENVNGSTLEKFTLDNIYFHN